MQVHAWPLARSMCGPSSFLLTSRPKQNEVPFWGWRWTLAGRWRDGGRGFKVRTGRLLKTYLIDKLKAVWRLNVELSTAEIFFRLLVSLKTHVSVWKMSSNLRGTDTVIWLWIMITAEQIECATQSSVTAGSWYTGWMIDWKAHMLSRPLEEIRKCTSVQLDAVRRRIECQIFASDAK